MITFIRSYVKSMRLYYSFVTGMAGWLGVAYYEYLASSPTERSIEIVPSPEKKLMILALLFLSWGINQIINDFLGLKEDRINAPHRPMVTGELNPRGALILSLALILVSAAVTWFFLEPVAVVFLFAGVILNVTIRIRQGVRHSRQYRIRSHDHYGAALRRLCIRPDINNGFIALPIVRAYSRMGHERAHDVLHLFQGLPGRQSRGEAHTSRFIRAQEIALAFHRVRIPAHAGFCSAQNFRTSPDADEYNLYYPRISDRFSAAMDRGALLPISGRTRGL